MALIKPDVYAGLVREKFEGKMKISQLATNLGILKNTTVGETITFPIFQTISEPIEMVKGTELTPEELDQSYTQATIKQVGKAVRVYDIDNITAFGNHINEAATQQGIVFARKLDKDLAEEALKTPLKFTVTTANALTAQEINSAMVAGFQDEQDTDEIAGIVINSLVLDSFFNMNEFVDANLTHTTNANAIITNGLVGYFRGIPVYLADHGTLDIVNSEPITFIIKKNSLAYMEKRDINIELERLAKLKATDVVADYIYATHIINEAGIIVLKKTI